MTSFISHFLEHNVLEKEENGIKYYTYSSNENAVDYDTENNKFLVRKYTERSKQMTTYDNENTRYEFLPFSYWNNQLYQSDVNSLPYQFPYEDVNLWYGMTMEFDFYMSKDGILTGTNNNTSNMKFEFSGDDDVWVFIDNVLVLDLGGTHGAVDGYIDFATGKVEGYLNWEGEKGTVSNGTANVTTIKEAFEKAGVSSTWNGDTFADYSQHTLKFFYLERGGNVANCKIKFNMPILPPGGLLVQKSYEGEDIYKEDYEFTLYQENNAPVPNTKYTVDGVEHTTDINGKFYLKAGQIAVFELTNYEKYYVKETSSGQNSISSSCIVNDKECTSTDTSDIVQIKPDEKQKIIFTNKLKTFNLTIKKIAYDIYEKEDNSNIDKFEFEVILKDKNGSPINISDSINSKYIVDHDKGIVTFELKNKEEVTITNIPINTKITLKELNHDGYQTLIKNTQDNSLLNSGDTYEFELIDNKGITVYNIPGVILPETGGSGIINYLIIGISLILFSGIGYRYFNKWKGCDE